MKFDCLIHFVVSKLRKWCFFFGAAQELICFFEHRSINGKGHVKENFGFTNILVSSTGSNQRSVNNTFPFTTSYNLEILVVSGRIMVVCGRIVVRYWMGGLGWMGKGT